MTSFALTRVYKRICDRDTRLQASKFCFADEATCMSPLFGVPCIPLCLVALDSRVSVEVPALGYLSSIDHRRSRSTALESCGEAR